MPRRGRRRLGRSQRLGGGDELTSGGHPPALIELALAYYRQPLRYPRLGVMAEPLPMGFASLVPAFGQSLAPSRIEATAASLGASCEELVAAARFIVRHALLAPAASPWRVLGLEGPVTPAQVRQHYQLLIRLFHPDRRGPDTLGLDAEADTADATRINGAHEQVRHWLGESPEGIDPVSAPADLDPDALRRFFQAQEWPVEDLGKGKGGSKGRGGYPLAVHQGPLWWRTGMSLWAAALVVLVLAVGSLLWVLHEPSGRLMVATAVGKTGPDASGESTHRPHSLTPQQPQPAYLTQPLVGVPPATVAEAKAKVKAQREAEAGAKAEAEAKGEAKRLAAMQHQAEALRVAEEQAQREEAARYEVARQEAKRLEDARQAAERQEAARLAAAREEAERLAARREAELQAEARFKAEREAEAKNLALRAAEREAEAQARLVAEREALDRQLAAQRQAHQQELEAQRLAYQQELEVQRMAQERKLEAERQALHVKAEAEAKAKHRAQEAERQAHQAKAEAEAKAKALNAAQEAERKALQAMAAAEAKAQKLAQEAKPQSPKAKVDHPVPTAGEPAPPLPPDPNKVVQRLTSAYAAGALDTLVGLFTPDARTSDGQGRSFIRTDYQTLFANTSHRKIDIAVSIWNKRKDGRVVGTGALTVSARTKGSEIWHQAKGRISLELVPWEGDWRIARMEHQLQ